MFDISSAKVKKVIVHRVGNKLRDEGIYLSPEENLRSKTLDDLLLKDFLAPVIRQGQQHELFHESDIALNTVNHYANNVFHDCKMFCASSEALAKHLYISSSHPNIGGGEFIVILFDGIRADGTSLQALGLFRVEGKNDYLDVIEENGAIKVSERLGISLEKIQKGAIILSDKSKVFVIDTLGQKTKYWIETFLKATPSQTPQRCAKVAGSLLKAVSCKVESPSIALEFARQLEEGLAESESLTVARLREISSNFIGDDEINELLDGARLKYGIPLENDLEIECKQLSKYAKDVVTRARIVEGVSLLISNPSAKITSIEVKPTKSGCCAVVDIQFKGD